ncbi:hypothetical protein BC828DRAFT_382014 [Blastocladiella britannica]|nr:hypothetical protein BC828DRAFT_382014 [Blastocladiella britannica]
MKKSIYTPFPSFQKYTPKRTKKYIIKNKMPISHPSTPATAPSDPPPISVAMIKYTPPSSPRRNPPTGPPEPPKQAAARASAAASPYRARHVSVDTVINATQALVGPSPLKGAAIHVIYDVEYADPVFHGDLVAPLQACAGGAGAPRVRTWVVTEANAAEVAAKVKAQIGLHGGVVVLHADMPAQTRAGDRFTGLRSFLDAGKFPRVMGHLPEYCENTLHKSTMHKLFAAAHVPHSESIIVDSIESVTAPETQAFVAQILNSSTPGAAIFLKLDGGFNSAGLTPASIARTPSDFAASATMLLREHNGASVVAQRFLGGREFTVAVVTTPAGPRAFAPVERQFAPGQLYSPPDGTPAESMLNEHAEPKLARACRVVALNAYVAVGGCAWGRVDLRCDGTGKVYVLEVNNTASFAPNSYFAMSVRADGVDRETCLEMVARAALGSGCVGEQ